MKVTSYSINLSRIAHYLLIFGFMTIGSTLALSDELNTIAERYQLIGVLGGNESQNPTNLAVIKDTVRDSTLILKVGDKIQRASPWFVHRIHNQSVQLRSPKRLLSIKLSFEGRENDDDDNAEINQNEPRAALKTFSRKDNQSKNSHISSNNPQQTLKKLDDEDIEYYLEILNQSRNESRESDDVEVIVCNTLDGDKCEL